MASDYQLTRRWNLSECFGYFFRNVGALLPRSQGRSYSIFIGWARGGAIEVFATQAVMKKSGNDSSELRSTHAQSEWTSYPLTLPPDNSAH